MGMYLSLCTLSDDNVRKLLADPPLVWKDDDTFGYCADYFDQLKVFVRKAAQRKVGLLIHIS